MRFQKKVSKKEFAREIMVGSLALFCLFAIFLFVAIQRATGKNLSPLAYLWPKEDAHVVEGIPTVVFKTKQSRQDDAEQDPAPFPGPNHLLANSNATTTDSPSMLATIKDPTDIQNKKQVTAPKPNIGGVVPDNFSSGNSIRLVQHTEDDRKDNHFRPKKSSDPVDNQFPRRFTPNEVVNRNDRPETADSRMDIRPPSTFPMKRSDTELVPQDPTSSFQAKNRPEEQHTFAPNNALVEEKPESSNNIRNPGRETSSSRTHLNTDNLPPNHPSFDSRKLEIVLQNALRVNSTNEDSYWTLAQQHYGDGKYFDRLAKFNNATEDSDNLPKVVLIPSLKELLELDFEWEKKSQADADDGFYVTRENETLFDIAKEQLGSAAKFADVLTLNKTILPPQCDAQTQLSRGLRLKMPAR